MARGHSSLEALHARMRSQAIDGLAIMQPALRRRQPAAAARARRARSSRSTHAAAHPSLGVRREQRRAGHHVRGDAPARAGPPPDRDDLRTDPDRLSPRPAPLIPGGDACGRHERRRPRTCRRPGRHLRRRCRSGRGSDRSSSRRRWPWWSATTRWHLAPLRTLTQAGRRVPDDVALAGFDDITASRYFRSTTDDRVQPALRDGCDSGAPAPGRDSRP